MKRALSITVAIVFVCVISIYALAATTVGTVSSWNSPPPTNHEWRPQSGSLTPTFYDVSSRDYAKTNVSFTLSNANVTDIKAFNNGTNSKWQNKGAAYFGMDTKNVPNGYFGHDMMDAYSVSTNLPNPKTDIENDDYLGSRNEEAEAIALGTVSASSYYVTVLWDDYRTGATSDNGSWNVNAEISSKGASDYNVIQPSGWTGWSGCTSKAYGNTSGRP